MTSLSFSILVSVLEGVDFFSFFVLAKKVPWKWASSREEGVVGENQEQREGGR